MVDRLTCRIGDDAVPVKFDLEFILDLDNETWRGLKDVLNKLADYEDTGHTPETVAACTFDPIEMVKICCAMNEAKKGRA